MSARDQHNWTIEQCEEFSRWCRKQGVTVQSYTCYLTGEAVFDIINTRQEITTNKLLEVFLNGVKT